MAIALRPQICDVTSPYVYTIVHRTVKIKRPNFTKFFNTLTAAVELFSFDDNGIHYVLPVLWMTPYFHIMGIMARLGCNDMGAVLKQVVQISNVFARVATQPTLFDFIVVYNGSNNCPVLLFVTLLFSFYHTF